MGHDERHCKKSDQPNQILQYGEWLRAQRGSKARLSKEEQSRNPINQQDYDMAMQERMPVGAKDGGYSTSLGDAHSGENLGNEKRGSLVLVMLEKGKHATQEVCQIQIQNSRNDGIGARKIGENIQHKKGKEKKNQNMGLAHSSMSTIGNEIGVSGVIHMGREETQNKEF